MISFTLRAALCSLIILYCKLSSPGSGNALLFASLFALLGFLTFLFRRRGLRGAAVRIAFIVGIESLRLKCEEEGSPLVAGVFYENGAVLVYAVIPLPFAGVALVHVDVVDAVAGRKPEVLIPLRFGPPSFTERVYHGPRLAQGFDNCVFELIFEVIVRARRVRRHRRHTLCLDQAAAHIILRQGACLRRKLLVAGGQRAEPILQVRGDGCCGLEQ